MAPENFNLTYSYKSDSWSYGVLIWEILNDGKNPGAGHDLMQLAVQIRQNQFLHPIPKGTHPILENLMVNCWKFEIDERPDFDQICTYLEQSELPNLNALPNENAKRGGGGDNGATNSTKRRRKRRTKKSTTRTPNSPMEED